MALKRDANDAIVSDVVRARADYTCEHCGNWMGKTRSCQAAHIISRGAGLELRWCTDNLVCLCATCHAHFGMSPPEFTRWLNSHLGEGFIAILVERRQRIRKWLNHEKKEMRAYYREILNDIEDKRKAGVTGYIETVSFC